MPRGLRLEHLGWNPASHLLALLLPKPPQQLLHASVSPRPLSAQSAGPPDCPSCSATSASGSRLCRPREGAGLKTDRPSEDSPQATQRRGRGGPGHQTGSWRRGLITPSCLSVPPGCQERLGQAWLRPRHSDDAFGLSPRPGRSSLRSQDRLSPALRRAVPFSKLSPPPPLLQSAGFLLSLICLLAFFPEM